MKPDNTKTDVKAEKQTAPRKRWTIKTGVKAGNHYNHGG